MTVLNSEAKQPEAQVAAETVAHQAIDTNQPAQQAVGVPTTDNTDAQSQEDPNWKAFREARKRDRLEREAAEARAADKEKEVAALKAAMEAAFATKNVPSPQAYQDYYGMNQQPDESEDQRIERMVEQKLAKKEEQYRREQAEYEAKTYPQRLMKDMPDFNQVCSQENLDYLDYHYPEVSRPLQRLGEGYDKWHDTYHAVKKLIPNHSTAKKEAMRADINSNKPRSMSSNPQAPAATGGGSESWREAEQKRAANWERMRRTLKSV